MDCKHISHIKDVIMHTSYKSLLFASICIL